ncbi:uncharacterized protein LOC126676328 [Mercurialis annua]|uniref:uncharacterized protein LOC126676328 n=1 Tax=Mercurialis annua TaxID=3986 RepID=UPI00216005C3|nr:uncharacterized protein LOC126676328 [Mercurialis annua]
METPSSTKRVTRSQTTLNNIPLSRKIEDSKSRKSGNETQNQDRFALIDITNDSPIVGLAMGSLETPSSTLAKKSSNRIKNAMNTPGSGEALLRGQVKTLLQKVEEEAVLSKISLENRPFLHLQGFVSNSPMGLLAPTPANTPQIPNLIEDNNGTALSTDSLPVIEEQLKICQVVSEIFEGGLETQKSLTRSLLLDFSEKSEICDSSSSECSTYDEVSKGTTYSSSSPLKDDDSASDWSIQVNASTHDEEEEEDYEYEEEWGVDELCEGIGKINVSESNNNGERGKHTRFVYNSDEDEIVEEEEVLHLKGLPTPQGKHLRFSMED